ncbi:2,3-diaminopropionate biosynthesis protein SbnB [Pedobacter cryoconitis]|uniref:2,3-diaminopropionate biosynthesis protein SbnB n=1 Tax=Pedobacter cryoconitis TaxID=188932 RepID=UPI00160AA69A|nr:2,3-diaminopropionate biosynthesis protein SbnB [Pedobacter cryoconitis]MBB5647628.1 ornithine cyclodeaminase [Pedobacter cryoconitis]
MLILNEDNILDIGINWNETVNVIEHTVKSISEGDFAQPLKPYLRYGNPKNRIIAMPAFVGGKTNMAGIKWIASFPENIKKNIPRAHSVVILNDADTGEPKGIITTALLSVIRTASVSGLIVKYFDQARDLAHIKIGISGFGPIGQYHLKMCSELLAGKIGKICLYDVRPIDPATIQCVQAEVVDSWEEAYQDADIFITCTVSDAAYIDQQPKPGSLHINVSLRDYKPVVYQWFKDSIVVDDWIEVCREKTDIEMMHLQMGLQQEDTKSIIDLVVNRSMETYPAALPVMFNPMGMAAFDIALGSYYYHAESKRLEHAAETAQTVF